MATAFGMLAAFIVATSPAILLLGFAGTAISMSLILMVSPAVNTGLATVDVVTPYTLLWLT